jgi:PTS system galactitol-specific IIA component
MTADADVSQSLPTLSLDLSLIQIIDTPLSQEAAIKRVAQPLEENGYVEPTYTAAVLEREKVFPTGLPTAVGLALPHTDTHHVRQNAISFAVLREPVTFYEMGSLDSEVEIYLICMLAISHKDSVIEVLKRLVTIFQNEKLLHQLKSADQPQQVMTLLVSALPNLIQQKS